MRTVTKNEKKKKTIGRVDQKTHFFETEADTMVDDFWRESIHLFKNFSLDCDTYLYFKITAIVILVIMKSE